MSELRIAFAGDRDISVWVLRHLLQQGVEPLALLVTEQAKASHAQVLVELSSMLLPAHILEGNQFREPQGIATLEALRLDYMICVHFPYIVPPQVLALPKIGVLNLHPAYLPYNRGWHTPSWAILEQTPIGATLHFMDEGVDTGDIVHQRELDVTPGDTADTLYQRLKRLELQVFQEAWPDLASGRPRRIPQEAKLGTVHRRSDLFAEDIQRINLQAEENVESLLRRLRALTTNRLEESAYFEVHGIRYRVQVLIHKEAAPEGSDSI